MSRCLWEKHWTPNNSGQVSNRHGTSAVCEWMRSVVKVRKRSTIYVYLLVYYNIYILHTLSLHTHRQQTLGQWHYASNNDAIGRPLVSHLDAAAIKVKWRTRRLGWMDGSNKKLFMSFLKAKVSDDFFKLRQVNNNLFQI